MPEFAELWELDWPDRYIHNNYHSAANIDPTKLKRAAFIAGASGPLESVGIVESGAAPEPRSKASAGR